MIGTISLVPLSTPPKLTAITRSKSSNAGSSAVPPPFTPALLHSTWIFPNAASASSAAAFRFARSATLVFTKWAALLPFNVSRALARWPSFQSAITTFMPSARNARAMPKPIPFAPPVMKATLPSRSCIAGAPLFVAVVAEAVEHFLGVGRRGQHRVGAGAHRVLEEAVGDQIGRIGKDAVGHQVADLERVLPVASDKPTRKLLFARLKTAAGAQKANKAASKTAVCH